MSSAPDDMRGRTQPSSGTITALMLTYRPIVLLILGGPALIMLLPCASMIFGGIIDGLTNQHSLLTIGLTILLFHLLQNHITKVAPTKEKGQKSLEESRKSLLLLTFVASIFAIRWIIVPIENHIGLRSVLTWSPSVSISLAFRLANGSMLLGLSVVARYIGPHSIVRCSSTPLLVNPYTRTLRNLFRTAESTLHTPQTICQPYDTQQSPASNRNGVKNPRRYQLPTSTSLCAQILISILGAILVAFSSVLPLLEKESVAAGDSQIRLTLILCCIMSTTMQLLLTTIHGTNHEIDPIQYRYSNIANQANLSKSLESAGPTILAIPVVIVAMCLKNASMDLSGALFGVAAVPFAIVLYLYIFDYTLRILMCKTPTNIKKLVEEASGGDVRMEVAVDVILRSLLHSSDELVSQLGTISKSCSVWMDLEAEEQRRNNAAIKTMAETLLFKTTKDEASPPLEDDILRLAILKSMGGTASNESAWKYNAVQSTLQQTINGGGNSTDAYAVPIVRGLCAYAGGLGEAIRLITEMESTTNHEVEWDLPPGALFMGGCAIVGATRWILQSTTNQQNKNSSLAIMIPVLLNSTFRLQQSLIKFSKAVGGQAASNETDHLKLLQTVSPQFIPLFNVCNDSVQHLINEGRAKPGFRLQDSLESVGVECKRWVRSKMSQ